MHHAAHTAELGDAEAGGSGAADPRDDASRDRGAPARRRRSRRFAERAIPRGEAPRSSPARERMLERTNSPPRAAPRSAATCPESAARPRDPAHCRRPLPWQRQRTPGEFAAQAAPRPPTAEDAGATPAETDRGGPPSARASAGLPCATLPRADRTRAAPPSRRSRQPRPPRAHAQAARDGVAGDRAGVEREHRELVAAASGETVVPAKRFPQRPRASLQELVAHMVTLGVIHPLEAVEVDDDDHGVQVVAVAATLFDLERAGPRPSVEAAGQVVRQRLAASGGRAAAPAPRSARAIPVPDWPTASSRKRCEGRHLAVSNAHCTGDIDADANLHKFSACAS